MPLEKTSLRSGRKVAVAYAVKDKWDREKYIPVNLKPFSLVNVDVYAKQKGKYRYIGTYINKMVTRKIVRKRGRRGRREYRYNYVRVTLPWYSTLRGNGVRGSRVRLKLVVKKRGR